MDFIDKLTELSARIQRQKESVLTEEAAKTAFVLPFIQALGYDIFNPEEVIPELTADHGVKKGEKVDYAIQLDKQKVILIECKPVGSDLEAKHAGQLFRYFSVTEARFGVLTDGIRYVFFSDLEKENKMDERPFFEFNLLQFSESNVDELKKFTKNFFDLQTIISTASNLKYFKALSEEIRAEFDSPSEEFVKILTGRVYPGRFTQQIKDQFTELTQRAMRDFIRSRVNERLKTALETDNHENVAEIQKREEVTEEDLNKVNGVLTTEDELEAYRVVRAIGAEYVDPERITMRDAKSYCAILLDNNNRRPICRLYFGKSKMSVSIFVPENETKIDINKISDIYRCRAELELAIKQYDKHS
ncbi:hypothetical protein SAMN04488082_106158 [Desulfomicrobium apsheronum]|uniref:Type I restriction enzyme R protein N-terminal domain-containing protein n=1 Tax=Desulfomicrobium apsheronum TaxID=52560 RepID=A0A1I3TWQ1_9BACT|nr:type I restriction enzyme HsdR N-terminal domain-containing protein [Desulfomicrobium apsheronum]SFJ75728.1 hypothetical protein SAMN04488082_106158 [Desulfomicrobium apsheronum]